MMDDDEEGGFFSMFDGDDDHAEVEQQQVQESKPEVPQKLKHDGCPVEGDPAGTKVRVTYDNQLYSATIKSYQAESNTYTIIWTSSGVLQYRTKPEDINWDPFVEEIVEKHDAKKDEDELWLAARRGSLRSVKNFVEKGIHFNETGSSQQRTPFYHAVFCGHAEVVEYLVSLGARDTDDTAFITANAQIRELLLKTGAGGKRRASFRQSPTTSASLSGDSQGLERKRSHAELRRASVSKKAGSHLAAIANQLTPAQYDALKQLDERLISVEDAMKAESRRPSAISKDAAGIRRQSQKAETKTKDNDALEKRSQTVTFKDSGKPKGTTQGDTGKKITTTSIVKSSSAGKTRLNPIVRFLVAVLPKRLVGKKKSKTTQS